MKQAFVYRPQIGEQAKKLKVVSTQQPPGSNHHDTFIDSFSDDETPVTIEKVPDLSKKQLQPQCEFCLKRSTFIFTHSISTLTKQGACKECQSKFPASLPSNNLTRIQSKARMMPYGVGNNYRRGVLL